MTAEQKLALVTGGTGGLGTAICRRLARDGRRVVASCHPDDLAGLAEWQQARRDEGLDIGLVAGDVSSAASSVAMIEEIEERLWQLLGESADTFRDYDLCFTGNTVGTAAGTLSVRVLWTI